ncbi:peptidylprolyl isomerase [Sphingomonas sabuli]|uniref:Parvulin-like PPIase n=2 Tax=Sphingomonas sabuli TaxID=2764186 RepID=A0A7G9L5U2_9SPHN|nr:peptidylprolyl isomerase [Sphingomonas sabuli]
MVALALGAATTAVAQTSDVQSAAPARRPLDLPENPQLYGTTLPSVVKATAIINGEIITQSDIDQRLAFLAVANGGSIPAEQIDALRQQVLRNLIDETLQIQAAKTEEIEVTDREIDRTVERVAQENNQTPEKLAEVLKGYGSSIRSLRRQIKGEIAWARLQQKRIESNVSVGDEEVQSVLDKLNAAKGTDEYKVGEIYLAAPGGDNSRAVAVANQILDQLQKGASFAAYARQYSEASTAAVGGDLGWVRPAQLPTQIATVVQQMRPGQVSRPVPVPGGISIVMVQDARKVLVADPRNAVLSLKQVSISFPAGMTRPQAEPIIGRFAEAARNVGGCGGADKIGDEFNGEVVTNDDVKLRDLPPALQEIMLPMQVGQSTPPFMAGGDLSDGARILVICGRDEVAPGAPTFDQVYAQLNEERVNLRSRRYLRDLRRDAIIDFR